MRKIILIIMTIFTTCSISVSLSNTSLFDWHNKDRLEYQVRIFLEEEYFRKELQSRFKEILYWSLRRNPFNKFQAPRPSNLLPDSQDFCAIDDFSTVEYPEIIKKERITNFVIVHAQKYFDQTGLSKNIQRIVVLSLWDYIYQKIDAEDYFDFNTKKGIIFLLDVFDVLAYNYRTKFADGITRIVLTGMYYEQCHYCEYRALLMRFMMARKKEDVQYLEIHLPVDFIYKPYDKKGYGLEAIGLSDKDMFDKYIGTLALVSRAGVTCRLIINGVNQIKFGDGKTRIRLYIWSKDKTENMIKYLSKPEIPDIILMKYWNNEELQYAA